jgi:hypothetical protein
MVYLFNDQASNSIWTVNLLAQVHRRRSGRSKPPAGLFSCPVQYSSNQLGDREFCDRRALKSRFFGRGVEFLGLCCG